LDKTKAYKTPFAVFQLVKNELLKFVSKKIVFIIFLVILVGVFGFALNTQSKTEIYTENDWRQTVQGEIDYLTYLLNDPGVAMADETRASYRNELLTYHYMLENDIEPLKIHSASNMILSLNDLFAIVVILGIILAGKIVTDEFGSGALSNLLALPCRRWKILLSKIIAIIVSCIGLIILLYLVSALMGWLFFGFDGFNKSVISCVRGKIIVRSVLAQSIVLNLYNVLTLLACGSLTLVLSLLLKNGIVSTCSSVLLYFLGTQITFALKDYSWIKYTLFANINFQIYLDGVEIIDGLTESFSVTLILIYIAVFTALSFYIFSNKRLTK